MTVPNERTRAVNQTRQFLQELMRPDRTPRIPRRIREQAASLLKHYPSQWDMDTIANREDGIPDVVPGNKVFGNSWL
jgi:hypothetical protein